MSISIQREKNKQEGNNMLGYKLSTKISDCIEVTYFSCSWGFFNLFGFVVLLVGWGFFCLFLVLLLIFFFYLRSFGGFYVVVLFCSVFFCEHSFFTFPGIPWMLLLGGPWLVLMHFNSPILIAAFVSTVRQVTVLSDFEKML